MKSVDLISCKAGAGKTSIAVNLAFILAKEGKNVCLLEYDFQAPSFMTYFKPGVKWINEYLLKDEPLENCLQDVSVSYNLHGKLLVGFADPVFKKEDAFRDRTPESEPSVYHLTQKASIKMLRKLVELKKKLQENPYEIEYFIVDSTPGYGPHIVNTMVITDVSLFITKLDNSDIFGMSWIMELTHGIEKTRTFILVNQIPKEPIMNREKRLNYQQMIEEHFKRGNGNEKFQFLGWIPTDLELQKLEYEHSLRTIENRIFSRPILSLEQPNHIFPGILKDLIPVIFEQDLGLKARDTWEFIEKSPEKTGMFDAVSYLQKVKTFLSEDEELGDYLGKIK